MYYWNMNIRIILYKRIHRSSNICKIGLILLLYGFLYNYYYIILYCFIWVWFNIILLLSIINVFKFYVLFIWYILSLIIDNLDFRRWKCFKVSYKYYLDIYLLNIQYFIVNVKGKLWILFFFLKLKSNYNIN